MQSAIQSKAARGAIYSLVMVSLAGSASPMFAAPWVEFDFARNIECRDRATTNRTVVRAGERLLAVTLPVSVRFRGVTSDDVEELDIEINGGPAGLRVIDFAPMTQLSSDVRDPIRVTTTTKRAASLDGSLGGTLPIPYAELVAHLTPTINAGTSRSESATETTTRLPPQQAVVVSGTAFEGRGAFFKLKRSSQTSLEGSHQLTVSFIAPAGWKTGALRVSCMARGQRNILWMKQPATLGRAAGEVELRLVANSTDSSFN